MKKTLLAAAVSLLTIQSASADDFFIGLDLGKTNLKAGGSHLHDGNVDGDITAGFRAGFTNDKYRYYGILGSGLSSSKDKTYDNGFKREEDLRYAQLTANFDYFFLINDKFKAFVGPHIGFGFVDIKADSNITTSDSEIASGFVYGGQFGAIFDATKNFNIEAGYSHSWTNINQKNKYHVFSTNGSTAFIPTIEEKIKIENVSRFYLAANYTF